jgi:hypothetical protein
VTKQGLFLVRLLLAVAGMLAVLALAVATGLAASGDVPRWARDQNCDGRVSVAEWFDVGFDDGWRPAVGGPAGCMEAFRFKDGLPDVVWCGLPPRCTPGRRSPPTL